MLLSFLSSTSWGGDNLSQAGCGPQSLVNRQTVTKVADTRPTNVGQQCWQTKVCCVFKKLANTKCWQQCWPAVYKLVRFLLANKRQIVCRDWLAVVNIMAAECTDASCVDYINYT